MVGLGLLWRFVILKRTTSPCKVLAQSDRLDKIYMTLPNKTIYFRHRLTFVEFSDICKTDINSLRIQVYSGIGASQTCADSSDGIIIVHC